MTRASSLGGVEPALVERMVALVHRLASKAPAHSPESCEAADIAALLPEPVDPDWIEAGEIAKKAAFNVMPWNPATMRDPDQRYPHHTIYDAIKRGRQLAQQDASNEA